MQRPLQTSSLIGIATLRGAIAVSLLTLAACGGGGSGTALTLSGTVSGLTTSGLTLTTLGVNLAVNAGAASFTFGPVLSAGVVYDVTAPGQPTGQSCTVTNGMGTASTANISNVVVTCSARTFNVGGTISGLDASGLVLANGSDTLSVPAGATAFTMPAPVAYGSSYAVTVAAQPSGLTCNVTNGAGTIGAEAVTNIAVACTAQTPTIGGSISGLGSATGLVLVNGGEESAVSAGATHFMLHAPAFPGSFYAVRVQSQPTGLTCSVSNGSGIVPTHAVEDVSITCSDQGYSLGGTIAGLGSGLVLSDGADSYSVPANATSFTMPTLIAYGSEYLVSVQREPAGLTCTVSGGSGTMPASAVLSVEVTCAASSYTLGGSISGLTSSGLVLTDGTDDLSVAANAKQFSMPNALASGGRYSVAIKAQPSGGSCRIENAVGTMSGEVGTVRITCSAPPP